MTRGAPGVGCNTCANHWHAVLRDRMVVLNGKSNVPCGRANGRLAKGRVAHAKHTKLGREAIQVQADAVEVRIGGAPG